MSGVLLVRGNAQSLLLEIDVIPDGDGLLVLEVGSRHRGRPGIRIPPPVDPAGLVVVEGGGEGNGHRRRRRGVVPILVVLRRVGIGVLGRVRGRGGEHVAVRPDLRLQLRRWPERRRRLLVVRIPPKAVSATTAASGAPSDPHSSPSPIRPPGILPQGVVGIDGRELKKTRLFIL